MKVLVTGGAGFIGSHLVEELVRRKHRVTVVDNLSSGSLGNLEKVASKIKFFSEDVSTFEFPKWQEFDIVYHLAAYPWVSLQVFDQRTKTFNSNVVGLRNILEQTDKNTLFVYLSTANFYGEGRKLKENSNIPSPIPSYYGLTKYVGESLIKYYGNPYIIFRPGTVVGTRGRCFPNRLVWCAVNNKKVEIFAHGKVFRDIIDVRDVVSALNVVDKIPQGTYNLGSNTETSGKELVEMVASIAESRGYKLKYEFSSLYPSGFVLESTLTTRLKVFWKPQYRLEETLNTLFDYYQKGGREPPSWESLS